MSQTNDAEAVAFKAEHDEAEAKKKAEEEAKAEAEKVERKRARKHAEYLETAGYADARLVWEKLAEETKVAKEAMDDLEAQSPYLPTRKRGGGGKRTITDPVQRAKADKKYTQKANNYDSEAGEKCNFYCWRSNGKDNQVGGKPTYGCKIIYKKKGTRNGHSEKCKKNFAVDMENKIQ